MDIFPDVQKLFNDSAVRDIGDKFNSYPFGESTMVVGFFLVLIIEQVVLAVKEKNEPVELVRPTARSRVRGSANSHSKPGNYGSTEPASLTNSIAEPSEGERLLEQSYEQFRPRSASVTSARSITGISDRPVYSRNGSIASGLDEVGLSMHQDPNSHSPIRSFIMLAALSLHSVFEGLAVGLQTTTAQVVGVFAALILHKCIIAFSIGLNLVQSRLKLGKIIISNLGFCIASPVGIAIGIILEKFESPNSLTITNGILQGLACGTFLYVTFFEVLPHEFNKPQNRVLKVLFVVIGFIVVNGVLFLEMGLDVE